MIQVDEAGFCLIFVDVLWMTGVINNQPAAYS